MKYLVIITMHVLTFSYSKPVPGNDGLCFLEEFHSHNIPNMEILDMAQGNEIA